MCSNCKYRHSNVPIKKESVEKAMSITQVTNKAKVGLDILPPKSSFTLFERVKMHIWNFILPPHVRLADYSDKERE